LAVLLSWHRTTVPSSDVSLIASEYFTGSIAFDCGFGRAWDGAAPDVGGRSHQRLSRQPDKGGLRPNLLKIHFALFF